MSSGAKINATRMPAEMVHAIGNDVNSINVSIIHANTAMNPKIQIERVSEITNRRPRGSGGDEGGKAATIAFFF